MTPDDQDRLTELTRRLEDAAERLRSGELGSDEAAALVEDCARVAGDAAGELERTVRAAGGAGRAGGQDELL